MPSYKGRHVKVYIDVSTDHTTPDWQLIGQQRGGGVDRQGETADGTHKDDDGWGSGVHVKNTWSINVDGALNPADPQWAELLGAYRSQKLRWFKIDRSAISGEDEEGQAWITGLPEEWPVDGVVTYSLTLQGDGALSAI